MKYGSSSESASNLLRCAGVTGTLQSFSVATTGVAFNVTRACGEKIRISLSAACRIRFAGAASPTTFDTSTADVTWGDTGSLSGVATGGILLAAGTYDRDVPFAEGTEAGVFLIVAPASGTADIVIEKG